MSDYLQRRKALREKFFPPVINMVPLRRLNRPQAMLIYDAPVGPVRLKGHGGRLARMLYSDPIGPLLSDVRPGKQLFAVEHPDQDWVRRASRLGYFNAHIDCEPHVLAYVAKALVTFKVDWRTVRTKSRLNEAVLARRSISYWLHTYCCMTTTEIGALMKKDHSTVVWAIRRFRQEHVLSRLAEASK